MRNFLQLGWLLLLGWQSMVLAAGEASTSYPSKPVRIVTGNTGTMMDIVGRQLAQRLGERWGRHVVVENRGGVGNSSTRVSQASPDGYSLLVADSTQLAIRPHLLRSLPYDPEGDFAPIALIATSPTLLVVHPSVSAPTLKEFVAWAKARPGGIDFANAGPWTNSHLTAEIFKRSVGINAMHVNYKGGGAATAAIVSGETKAGFSTPFIALPHVKAGRIKAYAATSDQRFAGALDIPTMEEAGGGKLVTSYWFGLLAPARTESTLIERIGRDVAALLRSPDLRSLFLEQGAEAGNMSHEEFGRFIRSESSRFKQIIDSAGIKSD